MAAAEAIGAAAEAKTAEHDAAVAAVMAWINARAEESPVVSMDAPLRSSLVLRVCVPAASAASMLIELVHSGVDFPHVRASADPELSSLLTSFAYQSVRSPVELVEHAVPLVASKLAASASATPPAAEAAEDTDTEAGAGAEASGIDEDTASEDEADDDDLYGSDDSGDELYGSSRPAALSGSAASSVAGERGPQLAASSSYDQTFASSAVASAVAAVLAIRDAETAAEAGAAAASSSASSGAWVDRGHWTTARRAGKFRIFSTAEVWVAARALSDALAKRFDIGSADARALLHHCKWDLEGVESMLSDADKREVVAAEAGMQLFCPERPPFPEGGTECTICYDDISQESQGHALECAHWFCLDCWRAHCHEAIGSGPAMMRARCPAEGCPRLVDDSTLVQFAEGRDVQLMQTVQAKSMDAGVQARECPGRACGRHAVFAGPTLLNVFCDCSACFCFQCGRRGHGPCPCELAVMFESKEAWAKDPENGRLDASLKDKIKPCPKCGIRTEKVDGCQYMACSQCRTPWCWMCGQFGAKVHHVYQCNEPPVKAWAKSSASTSFSEDGRFDWHLERFDNHMGSLQFATKRRAECITKRDKLLGLGMSPAQANLVVEAADLLVECRHVCAWTYAFAYFIADGPARTMLAFVQKDLETYTESLSEKVERQDDSELFKDETGIRTLVAALTKFKDAMVRPRPMMRLFTRRSLRDDAVRCVGFVRVSLQESWTPPPGTKILSVEEIEAQMQASKDRVKQFSASAGAKKRVKRK